MISLGISNVEKSVGLIAKVKQTFSQWNGVTKNLLLVLEEKTCWFLLDSDLKLQRTNSEQPKTRRKKRKSNERSKRMSLWEHECELRLERRKKPPET